jgi:hypothetical protein
MKLHILKDIFAVIAANIVIILLSLQCKIDVRYFCRLFMYTIILIDGTFLLQYITSNHYVKSSYNEQFGHNLPTYMFIFVLIYPLFVFLKYMYECYFI